MRIDHSIAHSSSRGIIVLSLTTCADSLTSDFELSELFPLTDLHTQVLAAGLFSSISYYLKLSLAIRSTLNFISIVIAGVDFGQLLENARKCKREKKTGPLNCIV